MESLHATSSSKMSLPNMYLVVDIIVMAYESAYHGYMVVSLLNKKCRSQYTEYYLKSCQNKIERNLIYDSVNIIRFQNEAHKRLTRVNYIGTQGDNGGYVKNAIGGDPTATAEYHINSLRSFMNNIGQMSLTMQLDKFAYHAKEENKLLLPEAVSSA